MLYKVTITSDSEGDKHKVATAWHEDNLGFVLANAIRGFGPSRICEIVATIVDELKEEMFLVEDDSSCFSGHKWSTERLVDAAQNIITKWEVFDSRLKNLTNDHRPNGQQ